MARRDDWLGWMEVAGPRGSGHVVKAASRRHSDPYHYYVAAASREEAVEALRAYGMHGFRFRTENNVGIDKLAVETCLRHFGVVMRRHVDDRRGVPEVAPPPPRD